MRKPFSKGVANTNGQKWIKYLIGEYYKFCQKALCKNSSTFFEIFKKQFLFSLQIIEIKEHAHTHTQKKSFLTIHNYSYIKIFSKIGLSLTYLPT